MEAVVGRLLNRLGSQPVSEAEAALQTKHLSGFGLLLLLLLYLLPARPATSPPDIINPINRLNVTIRPS